jgi:ribonuclease HI
MSLSQQTLFQQKYVTIATDISCDERFKIGTWACWIRYGGGHIRRTGRFKVFPRNTCVAETLALANALTIASKLPDWSDSRVIIHNEIEHVLRPVTSKNGALRKRDIERAEVITTVSLPLLDKAQSWELRDIKAHFNGWKKSDNPAKYAMNRWCDQESRKLMKYYRKLRKKELKGLDANS